MLRAKIEVSTNSDMIRSRRSVPTIEMPPISSGIAGGDDATEDEQEEQRQDREGDQLGLGEV